MPGNASVAASTSAAVEFQPTDRRSDRWASTPMASTVSGRTGDVDA